MKDIFGSMVALLIVIVAVMIGSSFFINDLKFSGSSANSVKVGNTIRVDYTGTLENGTVFDSSIGREPLEFVAGIGQLIPGFDNAVIGMKIGEEKDIVIQPEDAYGDYNPQAIQEIPRDQLDSNQEIEVGMVMALTAPDGQQIPGTVTEVTDEIITIDLNHQLVGQVLNFKIKIIEIVS